MRLEERIKQARKKANLSQQQLANILGLSFMTIRRWESGDVSPRVEEIQNIAKALNTSVEYLLDLQDKNQIKQQMDAALELADKSADEDNTLKEPISAGMTDNMFIIKDWNTQQTYYFPNNEEGRKFFTDFTSRLFHLRTPIVSGNSINGDNNKNNNLGVVQK